MAAGDPDAGQTLRYEITAGNTNGAFAINASTGRITVANPAALDFEITPTFALTVRVTDSGEPALASAATVTVTLADVNEVRPGVPNAPPVIGSLVVWSNGPGRAVTTTSVLTANTASFDPDGEEVRYTYQWYRNDVAIAGATSLTLDLGRPGHGDRGDTITVRVVPSDASASGAAVFASVRVVNSPAATTAYNELASGYRHAMASYASALSTYQSLGTATAFSTLVDASHAWKYASLAWAWARHAANVNPSAWAKAVAYASLASRYSARAYLAGAGPSAFYAHIDTYQGWVFARAAMSNP